MTAKNTTKPKAKRKQPARRKADPKAKAKAKPTTRKPKGKTKISEVHIHGELHSMSHNDINRAAHQLLARLLDRCTLNLITTLTGVTRPTLYRWLNPNLPIESINVRDAAWFILVCETSPRVQLLLDRPPLTRPRLAKRFLDDEMGEES